MQVSSLLDKAVRFGKDQVPWDLLQGGADADSPPLLDGGLPVAGHTVEFVRSTVGLLQRANRAHGEICRLSIGGKNMVAMFGPEANEAVFRAPDSQLNPAEAYKIMTPVFGQNMVYDAPPKRMNEQLKMLLPALKDRRMRTYVETVVSEVEGMLESWGDEGEVDLVDFCRVLTNYTSAHCLLGREFRHEMTEEFARVYQSLERGVTPLSYINANLPLPSFRERDRARARLVEMIGEIIQRRRQSGEAGEDFLQTLMETTYSDGSALVDDEITGMLLASMFAGHHTSSVTTAWTMLELLSNPSVRRSVVEQVDDFFDAGESISFDSLRRLDRTEWSVLETLRLHPPLFLLIRVVVTEFQYKGYTLKPGTWILLSPTVSHQMQDVFSDATCFDPERFAPERIESMAPFAFIPFGGGRHKCMGNAFALLQVKAIVAMLLRRYEFSLGTDPVGSDFHGLVMGPSEPCRIRYKRRDLSTRPSKAAMSTAPAVSADEAAAAGCPMHAAAKEAPAQEAPIQLKVDLDLCQSHAVCMGEAPDVFKVDGSSKVKLLDNSPANVEGARRAAKYCPTGAIKVVG